MTEESSKDRKWLRSQLIELLVDARGAGEEGRADHAACAKYAELLYRMLPDDRSGSTTSPAIEAARQRAREELARRAAESS